MSDDPTSRDAFKWEIRQSLVERLFVRWDGMGEMANQQRAEAAVQISTMMDEIEAWRQAMQKADRDIAQLRDALEIEKDAADHLHADRNNLRLELDRMVDKLTAQRDAARRERDEARRRLCEELLEVEGHPYSCIFSHMRRIMDDRDEARREACRWMAEAEGGTPEEHAAEMGWDCWNRPGNV